MISSIKTPGVYINEINAFPPSIAQVATAIPAFVGYTEMGPTTPTKIRSLLEYEQIFGGAAKPESIVVDTSTDTYTVQESKFKLYNSLRLFFANGGGEGYIVSIGKYKDNPDFSSQSPFNSGIDLLEKVDEPTLILFPDGVNLGATNLGLVHQHALMQCADLMDRFTIMDVIQKDGNGLDTDSEEFRDAVGNQNLKYGASYYPYLQASFGYQFRFMDIQGNGVDFKVEYPDLISNITSFENLDSDIDGLETGWDAAGMLTHRTKPDAATLPIDSEAKVSDYVTKCWSMLKLLEDPSSFANTGLQTLTNDLIATSLKVSAQKLFDFEDQFDGLKDETDTALTYTKVLGGAIADDDFNDDTWKGGNADFAVSAPVNLYKDLITTNPGAGDDVVSYPKVQGELEKLHTQIVNTISGILSTTEGYELKTENDLVSQLPLYPTILSGLNKTMNTVPPSGAVAGIYANVDATRGVWKAPANVSVNGIIGLTDDINHKEQGNMNIHESGKSINAIRKFTGKGMLVWGGRTLDGNSNDWRYINVRRLANMIEESAKKACMAFVFEPNVKQTWVNVKGMIDNYLTTLWGDGALAGAKPEDAFFVSVGLNQTMSAQDILEGRMIVKIGYAPSRPAEFIILEFTQTQQRS